METIHQKRLLRNCRLNFLKTQNQLLQLFYKNDVSKRFGKLTKKMQNPQKTPVPESLFNKVTGATVFCKAPPGNDFS